ncbi:hypothetical protein A9Q99_22790 [Gammaproteobacteria bacterium 45_16_T64]|nr:hypothetical protein A9Q99_22790 [Gammaproteobacteria bacterium 45_16_T64]
MDSQMSDSRTQSSKQWAEELSLLENQLTSSMARGCKPEDFRKITKFTEAVRVVAARLSHQ